MDMKNSNDGRKYASPVVLKHNEGRNMVLKDLHLFYLNMFLLKISYHDGYFDYSPKVRFKMGPLLRPEKKSGKFARLPAPPSAAAAVVYARKIETDDEGSGNSESLNAPNIINVQQL